MTTTKEKYLITKVTLIALTLMGFFLIVSYLLQILIKIIGINYTIIILLPLLLFSIFSYEHYESKR